MQLPPQFALSGPVYTGRGGLLARALREADGKVFVICGAAPDSAVGAMLQHFDAEVECAASVTSGGALPGRLEVERKSWLVYEGVHGEPLDLSYAWPIEAFWTLAPRQA